MMQPGIHRVNYRPCKEGREALGKVEETAFRTVEEAHSDKSSGYCLEMQGVHT